MCVLCDRAEKEAREKEARERPDPTMSVRDYYELQEQRRRYKNLTFQQIKPTIKKEAKPVMSSNVEYAVQSAVEQKLVERETKKRLEAIDSYEPFEDAENGTVLQFKKASTAKKDSKVVTYTAVKVSDGWALTGGEYSGSFFDWAGLVTWMSKPVPVNATDIKKASFA